MTRRLHSRLVISHSKPSLSPLIVTLAVGWLTASIMPFPPKALRTLMNWVLSSVELGSKFGTLLHFLNRICLDFNLAYR